MGPSRGKKAKSSFAAEKQVFYSVKGRFNKNSPYPQNICADLQTQVSQKEFRELPQKGSPPENKDKEFPHMAEGRQKGDRPKSAASLGVQAPEELCHPKHWSLSTTIRYTYTQKTS